MDSHTHAMGFHPCFAQAAAHPWISGAWRHGIGVDAAFDRMRDYARANHRRLSDFVRDVVTDPTRHPDLTNAC